MSDKTEQALKNNKGGFISAKVKIKCYDLDCDHFGDCCFYHALNECIANRPDLHNRPCSECGKGGTGLYSNKYDGVDII